MEQKYTCEEWLTNLFSEERSVCNLPAIVTFRINPSKEGDDGTRNACQFCAKNLESWGFPKVDRKH